MTSFDDLDFSPAAPTAAQLINQTSGAFEWYTPGPIVEAARAAMGSIDLDPASSAAANERVKAKSFFTEADDGLSIMWWGNVWLNHPFGRVQNPLWIRKVVEGWDGKYYDQLCCITYACTSEAWFQPLLKQVQCYLCPRTNYYLPNGKIKKGVTKGSVVTYFGPNQDQFQEAFKSLGTIKW